MFSSPQFLVPAAAVLSIQLAVVTLLYNVDKIRRSSTPDASSTRFGAIFGKLMATLFPLVIVVSVVGDAAALKAYSDQHQKWIAKEARAVEYEPLINAALMAKPNQWCHSNGYLVEGEVNPLSRRPCAQVGQFRVLAQYPGMSTLLEIYKVFEDGTVRAAAYQKDYDIGFIADETVTSLDELKTAFGVK
jgi:hypothetical protein